MSEKKYKEETMPTGWLTSPFANVAKARMGPTILAKDLSPNGLPVYSAGQANAAWGYTRRNVPVFSKGTIVISARGSIGYPKIPKEDSFTSTQTTIAVTPTPTVDCSYLQRFLQSTDWNELSSGAAIPMLTISMLSELEVPLAPLPEQKRIADKLEAVLGRVDACRTRLDRVPALLKRFRQSVLAAATSGKLTEDWREAHNLAGASKPIEVREDVIEIPESWSKGSLTDVIEPTRPLCYGVVQPGDEVINGAVLIRVQDMLGGRVNVEDLRTISKEIDADYKRSRVKAGDLLISVVGTIGRTSIVPANLEANIARAVARISCRSGIDSRWVNYWLSSVKIQWWLVSSSKEVARKTLNLSELATAPVAIPTLPEQAEIVRRVEALFAFADQIEARLAAAQKTVERLTPATLAKAFRGELVPQDPNDEPAAALLERIARQNDAKFDRAARKTQKKQFS